MYVCMYACEHPLGASISCMLCHSTGTLPLPDMPVLPPPNQCSECLPYCESMPANADFLTLTLPALPVFIVFDAIQYYTDSWHYVIFFSRIGLLNMRRESHQLSPGFIVWKDSTLNLNIRVKGPRRHGGKGEGARITRKRGWKVSVCSIR
ncbi:hypothetical protein BO99DRAFT_7758 [Aspergillus violaceofuscus CBS 115571]|uniref:Uncharacterized protein n=1 Tax=Aspergillus violaceofuscus (strain CBS 115571) TaxID=1450538 RepID=A0A2V5HDT2_ASPV1|nr:hypothetical protein BO99DRAFT_7758 [Aspergillus violaceofuscus CBS 115571]